MKIRITFLFLSLFFMVACSGQQEDLQVFSNGFYSKQYSESSGLVSNLSKKVFQDSRGLLWIYTFEGVSQFDGRQFVNFSTNEGLPALNVIQVSEDSLGYIYVATVNGIARYTGYNKTTGSSFYVYPQTQNMNATLRGFQAVDSNTILFSTDKGTAFLLQNGKVKPISAPSKDGWCSETMQRNKYKYYYFHTTDTLRVFDSHFSNVANMHFKETDHTMQKVDRAGNLHMYCQGIKSKITGRDIVRTSVVPDSILRFDCLDTMDKMTFCKGGSIYQYADGKTVKIFDIKPPYNCNSIDVARDGSIWVSTSGMGIFRLTPRYHQDTIKSGFYFRCVNGKRVVTKNIPAELYMPQEAAMARFVLLDRNNNAWFSTRDGLYKKERGKKAIAYVFPGDNKRWSRAANSITNAVEVAAGDIWFCGSPGIIHYRNGQFTHYNEKNGLTGNNLRIYELNIDKDGSVLFNSYNQLFYIQGDTVLPVKINGIQILNASKIRLDARGHIWIDYKKKLYKISKQSPGNYTITDSIFQDPLIAAAEVRAFDFDRDGNCWVGYIGGKIRVFFINAACKYSYTNSVVFTTDNGLAPIISSNYNILPDEEGNMVIVPVGVGNRQLFLFSIKDALTRKNVQPTQINLTGILINHKYPDWASRGYTTGPGGFPYSCKLSYSDNDILFNYTASSLSDPGSVLYQTMLKGYDDEWHTTTATMANYTSLPPGKYTFLIKATNANGAWSEPFEYTFSISPPWYKTWWAVLLWVAIFSSLILFFLYLRINAIRMTTLRESNMFKSSLIGLISHDMMTPLHYIAKVSSQLKMYMGKLSQETTLESLGDINVTASSLRFFGESILHWINLQNTEFRPAMEKFQVKETITSLVEFHQLLAVEKGNVISHDIQNNLFCYQDPTLIRIILHNLLLNANKFTADGKIKVFALLEEDWLVVKVVDSGKGMDQSKVDSLNQLQPVNSSPGTLKEKGWGMGYKMIIDLLKFSKGSLHVKSKINNGTEVTIKLFSGKKGFQKLRVAS